MSAVSSTRAEKEVVRKVVVQSNDCIVWQERKLLAVRIVSHVTSSIFKVSIQVEVRIQVCHRLLQMVHNVSDVCIHVLIVRSVHMIVEKLVVSRTCPRVRHLQLFQPIVHVGVVRVASCYLHITRATSRMLLVR